MDIYAVYSAHFQGSQADYWVESVHLTREEAIAEAERLAGSDNWITNSLDASDEYLEARPYSDVLMEYRVQKREMGGRL